MPVSAMMIARLVSITLFLLAFAARDAAATSFTFYGSSAGGTGSASMTIDIVGNTLTLTLNNTSPILLDNLSGPNAPGITGFGFDLLNNPLPTLTSWSLVGQQYDGTNFSNVTIGSNASTLDWLLGTFQAGVWLDYLPQVQGVDGALYNPAAVNSALIPGGSNSAYFTTATLTMTFGVAPVLAVNSSSPYVRFQNVGLNGAGSLKLYGTPVIPEPTTLLLVGSGLAIFGTRLRRRRR